MSLTVTDPTLLAAFTASEFPVELRSPDGKLVGRFVPSIPGMRFPELGITDEEMDRRLNDPDAKWVTGDEVMARLRSLRETN